MKKALLAVTLLLFWASSAWCQRDGIPSFTAYDSHDTDTINLTSLVPTLHFRGPAGISLTSPQSCFASAVGTSCSIWGNAVQPLTAFYFIPDPYFGIGPLYNSIQNGGPGCWSITISGFLGMDNLSVYPMPGINIYNKTGCGGPTSGTGTSYDGSGYSATFSGNVSQIPAMSNLTRIDGTTVSSAGGTVTLTDAFGNTQSYGNNYTNQLGATLTLGGTNFGVPTSFQYVDTTGTNQNVTFTNGSATTYHPLGNCGTGNTGNSVTPITSINFPDSTSVGLTWDTNSTGIDGLIKTVTLRTGGTITYGYGSLSQNCNAGWALSTLTRTTADGVWNYSATTTTSSPVYTTTTVLDPGKNKTVYVFWGGPTGQTYTSTIDRYQNTGTVASPSYTHISETSYCYNTLACTTSAPFGVVITQLDTYEYTYNGATQVQMSHDVKLYDSTYGLITSDAKTDSITSQTITTTYAYGTYSSGSCSALGNTAIHDHICTVTTKNGTTWLSGSTYTYNTNGALTSSSACLSSTCTGSSALTTTYTPTTQGTYSAIQDPNGQTTNYTYGSCNSLMPTDVTTTVNSIAIDRKATWNCNAGVVTDTTDPNSNEDDYTYDSMNRISTYHDRMGDTNTTSYAYGTPTLDHVKVTDNIGVVSYQYVDGLGRPTNHQVCETSGCTTLDTSSTSYAWNGVNFETKTYVPCTQTTLNAACTTVAVTADVNPMGPSTTTDANSGTGTVAVNSKDFSFTAGPAPSSQEHTKVIQTEVDGFGRVTSTCALESSGGTTCGQTMGNSGILTSNVYSFATGAPKVVTTRGSQSHTTIADAVGRTTSVQTPEIDYEDFLYDSIPSTDCGAASSSSGDLVETYIPQNDGINVWRRCYYYDGLHRVTVRQNNVNTATNPCLRYRYDSTANNAYTKPTGYPSSGANIIGRLMEASTDDCTSPLAQAHMITDEWFAYDNMGRMTDMWEYTTTGATWYHTTVAYDADGVPTSLGGIPGISTLNYVTDGEERWNTAKLGSTTTVVSGVTYDAASRPTQVSIGSSTDKDTFSYDNVGNMTQYQFFVGSANNKGVLTWNDIGSLGQLAITDGLNTNNTQTCKFGTSTTAGYDDVGRILDDDCGTVWAQTYSYDQYDNLTKAGSRSWNPGYSSTTNQYSTNGATYDLDGNLTKDATGGNTYTWNVYGQMASENSTNAAYDAFGRMITYNGYEFLYGPMGRIGQLSSGAVYSIALPLPGGMAALDARPSPQPNYLYHYDWIGSARTASTLAGASTWSKSFSPYGDAYNSDSLNNDRFAGMETIFDDLTYSTPNRGLGMNGSRWLSPDPAHSGWNAYAYVTDPNTQTDPSGLDPDPQGQNPPTIPPPSGCWEADNAPVHLCESGASTADPPANVTQGTMKVDIPLNLSVEAQGFLSGWTGGTGGTISRPSDFLHRAGRWINSQLGLGGDATIDDAISNASGLIKAAGVGGEAPAWEAPTFEVFQPSEEVLSDVRGFVKEHPEYINAKCGDCGKATGQFLSYGLNRGRYYAWQNVNRGEGGPLFQQTTNPMFDYTVVYGREGLVHAVNLSPDKKWVLDFSATQFRNDYPPRWVSYPYIVPVDPNSF